MKFPKDTLLREKGFLSHPPPPCLKLFFFFYFWPCGTTYRILVPCPGIEPMPPAVESLSLNHWTTREVLLCLRVWFFCTKAKFYFINSRLWKNEWCKVQFWGHRFDKHFTAEEGEIWEVWVSCWCQFQRHTVPCGMANDSEQWGWAPHWILRTGSWALGKSARTVTLTEKSGVHSRSEDVNEAGKA